MRKKIKKKQLPRSKEEKKKKGGEEKKELRRCPRCGSQLRENKETGGLVCDCAGYSEVG